MQTTSTIAQIKDLSPEELIERAREIKSDLYANICTQCGLQKWFHAQTEYNLIRKEYEAQTNQPLPL